MIILTKLKGSVAWRRQGASFPHSRGSAVETWRSGHAACGEEPAAGHAGKRPFYLPWTMTLKVNIVQ